MLTARIRGTPARLTSQGQFPNRKLANTTYDPFVAQAENNGSFSHTTKPAHQQDVFMEFISGNMANRIPAYQFLKWFTSTRPNGLTA